MKLCYGSAFALLFRHMVGSCLKQLLKLFVIHYALVYADYAGVELTQQPLSKVAVTKPTHHLPLNRTSSAQVASSSS
jgi:hypothetical protein